MQEDNFTNKIPFGCAPLSQMAGDYLQHCHPCHWQQGDCDLWVSGGWWLPTTLPSVSLAAGWLWSVCVRWLVIAYNTAICVTGSRVTVICVCHMAGDCLQHCHQCHWQQGDCDLCLSDGWWLPTTLPSVSLAAGWLWSVSVRWLVIAYNTAISVTGSRVTVICVCQMAGDCLQHCHQCHWQQGDCDLWVSDGWWHAADYLQHCHQCHWLWSVCATGAGDLPISTWGGGARPAHLQVPRHWTQPGRWGRDHRQHSCQSVCQICLQQVSQQHHTCWQSWVLAISVNLLS